MLTARQIRCALAAVASLAIGCVPVLESDGGPVDQQWVAPENTWPLDAPPYDAAQPTGFFRGDVVPDFRLVDQHGDEVSLWQFYGHVVVVDISTMWCRPCQQLAEGAEETYLDFVDHDVMYITVLPENVHGQPPTVEDLNTWADYFELSAPVVTDPGKGWSAPAVPGNQYPFVAVLDRELVVQAVLTTPVTDERVRVELEALVGE